MARPRTCRSEARKRWVASPTLLSNLGNHLLPRQQQVSADSFDSDCSESGDAIDHNQYQEDEKDGEQNETDGGDSSSEGPSGGEEEPISQTLSSSEDSLDGKELDREELLERVRNQPCRGSSTFAEECAKSDAMQLKDEADFEAKDAEESRVSPLSC